MLLSKLGEKGKAADVVFLFPRPCVSKFYSSQIILIAGQGHCPGWRDNHGKCHTVSQLGFPPHSAEASKLLLTIVPRLGGSYWTLYTLDRGRPLESYSLAGMCVDVSITIRLVHRIYSVT